MTEYLDFEGHRIKIPEGRDRNSILELLRNAKKDGLEKVVLDGLQVESTAGSSPPPASPLTSSESLRKRSELDGIETNLVLVDTLLSAFGAQKWEDLKGRYQRDDTGEVVLHHLSNDLVSGDELADCIASLDAYANRIKNAQEDFAYTDFQFFAVLFTEIVLTQSDKVRGRMLGRSVQYPLLRLYDTDIPNEENDRRDWVVNWHRRWGQNVLKIDGNPKKAFATKLDQFEVSIRSGESAPKAVNQHFQGRSVTEWLQGIDRLAYYMATGSGKTHLLHINLLQAEAHLPGMLGMRDDELPPVYLVAPNSDLAKQHYRDIRRVFREKRVRIVEDDNDKTVGDSVLRILQDRHAHIRVITTHQLSIMMGRVTDGLFGHGNPFGEANIVFADEGHKGASKDTGWRGDRDRLAGERGFCFEYSATFGQSIKVKNAPLLQDYAKAIIFDYPYRLFYRDGYGKQPAFFPETDANAIAKSVLSGGNNKFDLRSLTANDRWELFLRQLVRFTEQITEYSSNASNPEYLRHRFASPLLMMMCLRVDASGATASNIKEVIELLHRFSQNKQGESEAGAARLGGDYTDVMLRVFKHSDSSGKLVLHKLNERELGLSLSGGKYFGVVYVGSVASIGLDTQPDRITGSLIAPFLEHGDNPDIHFVIAARMLTEGWNSHRVSSLGLVELGKSRGSLVVQLFGRGVRLAGTVENLLKRDELFPTSERFDVYGYDAAYLRTFIEEAEAADIIRESTLEIRVDIKPGEPRNRLVPQTQMSFAEAGHILSLEIDEHLHGVILKLRDSLPDSIEIDPRPFLDFSALYESILGQLPSRHLLMSHDTFNEVAHLVLAKASFPRGAHLTDRQFLFRWALARLRRALQNWYRRHEQQWTFNHAALLPVSLSHNRSINFGAYRVSGPTDLVNKIADELVENSVIPDIKFKKTHPGLAPIARLHGFDAQPFAVRCNPHLFEPLLLQLNGADQIRVSPDQLNEGELKLVEALHAYTTTHPREQIGLLRNQREWGFSGFYPDFVLWLEQNGEEHIAFLDPKGLVLRNTEDVLLKLLFSLEIGTLEDRIRESDRNVHLTSFVLLNHPIENYIEDKTQRALLENIGGKMLQEKVLGIQSLEAIKFDDDELREWLHALNAVHIGQDIQGLLDDIANNSHSGRRKTISALIRAKLPSAITNELKELWEILSECTHSKQLHEFREQYKFDHSLSSIELIYLAAIIRRLFGSAEYDEFIIFVQDEGEKKIASEVKDLARNEILDAAIDGCSLVVPGIRIATSIGKIILRRFE